MTDQARVEPVKSDQVKPDGMKQFIENLKGIVLTPGQTLGRLMKEKNWVPVFILLVFVMAIFTYLVYPIQMEKMAKSPEFAEFLPEGQGDGQYSAFARVMGSFFSIFALCLSLVLSAFFIYLFFGIGGSEGRFNNYFSLAVNASIIDVLFTAILGLLTLILSMNVSLIGTPFLLIFSPEPKSMAFIVLSRLNLFALWYLAAVAAGISVFSKMSLKKCLVISGIYFIFKTSLGVAFAYIMTQIIQSVGSGG